MFRVAHQKKTMKKNDVGLFAFPSGCSTAEDNYLVLNIEPFKIEVNRRYAAV